MLVLYFFSDRGRRPQCDFSTKAKCVYYDMFGLGNASVCRAMLSSAGLGVASLLYSATICITGLHEKGRASLKQHAY